MLQIRKLSLKALLDHGFVNCLQSPMPKCSPHCGRV